MRMIILIGSLAMVKMNIARGGPKARRPHPKNSMTVISAVVYSPAIQRSTTVNLNTKCITRLLEEMGQTDEG